MQVRNREQEVVATAFDLTPWMAYADQATFQEEIDEDPYLTGEEADTDNQEDMSKDTPEEMPYQDTNIAGVYFREVSKVPLLTREREVELAKRIQDGQRKIYALLRKCAAAEGNVCWLSGELENGESKRRKRAPSQEDFIGDLVQKLETVAQGRGGNNGRLRDLLAELRKTEADVKAAKAEMIQSNLRLVVCIAKKYINKGLSFLDLIQEGNLGLMKAVGRYDYRRGYKFSTYASWWIRQAITRALGDKSRTIRIPNHLLEMKSKILKSFHHLVREYGRKPAPEEIATETKIPLANVQKVIELIQEPVSLETPVGDDGGRLQDLIGDDEKASFYDDLLEDMDRARKTRDLLSLLNWREEQILRLRFGIGEPSTYTLEQVGKRFGISRERVRQIEQKALNRLKGQIRAGAIPRIP
jgi:RNA polymerase primary sigma factor